MRTPEPAGRMIRMSLIRKSCTLPEKSSVVIATAWLPVSAIVICSIDEEMVLRILTPASKPMTVPFLIER